MPLEITSIQEEINKARDTIQSTGAANPTINDDNSIRFLMEAEIRSLKEQQQLSIDRQVGYDGLNINELEALVINELKESCKQLEYAISFYQSSNKSIIEEKEQITQQQDDLKEIYNEFENQTAENSRQIESMNTSSSHIYENKVESYKRDYTKLRKANHILINEIKDVLSLCYGNRKSSTDENELLSKEILSILEECIRKTLSKDTADKYITVTPEVASGEAIQLLLTANLIQPHKTSSCRFCIIDFWVCFLNKYFITPDSLAFISSNSFYFE